jgi:putative ABC transport system ATP-binding protein
LNGTKDRKIALEASSLRKAYGAGHTEVLAVRDVALSIFRGEIVALLGPSGAGKSTLLSILGLLRDPDKGIVSIGGETVFDGFPRVDGRSFRRRHIGFIFQKANLIPFLSAEENVRLAMEINDVPGRQARKRAMELLEHLGIAPRAGNLPSKLSGGEQQRVAVARALANKPELLLADEPTAALDSVRGRQVMELFRDVAHENNAGVVVVTHDHRALDVFDRALQMEDGVLRPSYEIDREMTAMKETRSSSLLENRSR